MLDQSAPRMLAWVTRWKPEIYQSIYQAKQIPKQKAVSIWKIKGPKRTDEPEKKVDNRRITQSKQKKYKETRITSTLKVTDCLRSNSRIQNYDGKSYSQANFDDLEISVINKNNDLFGNTFND